MPYSVAMPKVGDRVEIFDAPGSERTNVKRFGIVTKIPSSRNQDWERPIIYVTLEGESERKVFRLNRVYLAP